MKPDDPRPASLAGVTACVTDDTDGARARSAAEQGIYGALPAYQHMMQAEGVRGAADLVVSGPEDQVAEGLQRYAQAGAADVRVTNLTGNDEERQRTRALLRSLAR